jgi:hypothetical protein
MTVDELLAVADANAATDEMLVIDPDTRQINLPGVELIFGVESDAQAERKYFYCPRYVGNGLDLASCFIRVNYRNANGVVDAYLVDDMSYTDDAITFSWALHRNVTLYKGQVQFVVCCNRPGSPAAEWNTTVTTGIVLAGLEPDSAAVEAATSDAISGLLATVDAQVANVTAEGATQVSVVRGAAEAAETAAVAEIEAKGASTLATIPEDYTTVQSAVRGAANAIRKKVSGEVIRVDDVSPMEHQPIVRVSGKNLFYSSEDFDGTLSGISYSMGKNTSEVTFSGTANKENALQLPDSFSLPKGTYCVSVTGLSSDAGRLYLRNRTTSEVIINHVTASTPKQFTLTEDADIRTYLVFKDQSTYDTTVISIQIEKGGAVTEYTPYIDPTTVTVRRCGKNLLSLPYYEGQKVERDGITATVNADGGVHLVGTATANYFYRFGSINLGSTSIMAGNNNGRYSLQNCAYDSANKFVYHQVSKGQTVDKVVYAMVEAGTVKTAYETPSTVVTQIPSSDGTVSGLSAVSPTMTLMTDTPSVSIECEYSRDTNKVVNEILEMITALTGVKE